MRLAEPEGPAASFFIGSGLLFSLRRLARAEKSNHQPCFLMPRLLVYATALSRLHADLTIVRLKQADVETTQISIVHPKRSRPNSVLCWLNGSSRLRLSSGEFVSVAGLLRLSMRRPQNSEAPGDGLGDRLRRLGLTPAQSEDLEQSLLENRIIVMIEVPCESELPGIFRVLHSVAAENVHAVDLDQIESETGRESRRDRGAMPPLEPALAAHGALA